MQHLTKSRKTPVKRSTKHKRLSKSMRKSRTKRSYTRRKSRSRKNRKNESLDEMSWKELAPIKNRDREEMKDICFLDKENKKYPVCAKRVNSVLCKGLNAARSRAVANENENIVAKADRIKKIMLCGTKQAFDRDKKLMIKSLQRSSRGNRSRRSRRNSREQKILKMTENKPKHSNINHLGNINYSTKYQRKFASNEDV
jgi:hypothetical protein